MGRRGSMIDNAESGTPQEAKAPLAQGSQPMSIGKYRIVRLLGRGGMGAVYQAFDPHLERDVALKVMLPQFADQPEHKLRFEREARAVARMMHPNVVTVFDLGYHTDGSPYIVMELLKGRDLLHLLRDEPALDLRRKVDRRPGAGGPRTRAQGRHRPSRHQARQRLHRRERRRQDHGLRDRPHQRERGGRLGPGRGHGELHVAGAGDGRSGRRAQRSLQRRLHAGGDGRRAAAVRVRQRDEHALPHRPQPADPGPAGRRGRGPAGAALHQALAKDPAERFATAAEFAAALRGLLERPSFGRLAAVAPAAGTPAPPSLDVTPTRALPAPILRAAAPSRSTPPPVADPTPLFRLLREIYVGGKSGHLHLTSGHERRRLRILKGRIVDGSSDVQGERLGDVLVRYGLLSQADLERAVAVVLRERKKMGQVLGEMGLLDRPRLEDALGLHVREVLFVMLDRPGASFLFEEMSESLIDADLSCRLSTGELILEATRRVQDPALVRRAIGDPSRVLVLSSDPLLRMQKITLTPIDGFVLSRIDGTLSAREVLSLIPLPAEDVERSLFGLLCTGMVGHLDDQPLTRPLPRRGDTAPRAAARPRPVPRRPTRSEADAQRRSRRRRHAPDPAVHGARDAVLAAADAAVHGTRRAAAAIPGPRTRGDAGDPHAGDRDREPAGAETSAASTEPRSSRLSPDEVRRIILETHERLADRTHYEVLGIEREASDAEVRQAHARLVRALHPDACSGPEFDDLQEQRAAVFVRVGQAYEVLRDLQGARRLRHPPQALEARAHAAAVAGWLVLTAGSPPAEPGGARGGRRAVPARRRPRARPRRSSRRRSTGT